MNVRQLDRSDSVDELMASGIAWAMRLSTDPAASSHRFDELVDGVVALESNRSTTRLVGACAVVADSELDVTFERGWQPAELFHVLGRLVDKPGIAMTKALIGAHSRRTCALSAAPLDWRDQLVDLGVDVSTDLVDHRLSARINSRTFWASLFRLLGELRLLPAMVLIAPPPSQWYRTSTAAPAGRPNPKMLNTIRGLLAKAESSTFDAEAETFSAKAQELMTRYAIDSAVLDSAVHGTTDGGALDDLVVTRRIIVENPYADAKMQLMFGVAATNGARSVRYAKLGLVSITGMPVDLDLCELLYTSLLVQSARALEHAGKDSRTRSRGFRRAFLLGYAWRIRERLEEARERANSFASESYGGALVPLLAERDDAVSSVFRELYPSLRTSRTTVSDRHGVQQGRAAAEHADLTGGRDEIDK